MADLTLNELAAKCAEQAQEIERCRKAVQPHPEQMGGAGWKLDASIPTADKVEAYAEIMDDELKATSELLAGANEDLLALRAQLDRAQAALRDVSYLSQMALAGKHQQAIDEAQEGGA